MIVTRMASNHSNSAARVKEVIDRAKEIIDNHFLDPPYHIVYKREEKREATAYREEQLPATIIEISNKDNMHNGQLIQGNYCLICKIYDGDLSTLHIALVTRCGLTGTKNLERVINFSKACGFLRMTLDDHSKIQYDTQSNASDSDYSINLQQLQRLMTGQSWYGRFGFTNENVETYRDRISAYIGKPIRSAYSDELMTRLQNYIAAITPETSVSNAAKCIYAYLNGLCPDRICKQKDLTHIDKINSIVNEMYQEMLVELDMKDKDFIRLELIFSHQKGSSRTRRTRRKNKTARRRKRTLRR